MFLSVWCNCSCVFVYAVSVLVANSVYVTFYLYRFRESQDDEEDREGPFVGEWSGSFSSGRLARKPLCSLFSPIIHSLTLIVPALYLISWCSCLSGFVSS